MQFQDPHFLILILPLIIIIFYTKKKQNLIFSSIRFSSQTFLEIIKPSFKVKLAENTIFLRGISTLLIILALARPQSLTEKTRIYTEGIDIVLAIDCSTSMLAEDFKLIGKRKNRLEVVKNVTKEFIQGRQYDRIGIVAFAGYAYIISPLTLDYGWLLQNLERITTNMIEDGTAIGSGICIALNRLKNTKAKGKVIILLTDGVNNAGNVSPLTAAEIARTLKVKVYTIGAGTKGLVPYPTKDFFGNTIYQSVKIEIDEESLKKIAEKTNALYFRAENTQALRAIYQEIDKLEKTPLEEEGYIKYKELFPIFLFLGLALLLLEIVLSHTFLRKIP